MPKPFDSRKAILASLTAEDRKQAETDTNAHLPTIDPMQPRPRTREGLDDFEQGVIDGFNWLKKKSTRVQYKDGTRLVSACDAGDVAMKTLCVAWQIRDRFTGDPCTNELRAWLFTVLKHVARDEYKRHDNATARTAVRQSCFDGSETQSPGDAYEDHILKNGGNLLAACPERALVATDELAAVARMPDAEILVDVGIGLSMREISDKHGIAIPAAKARLYRARQHLANVEAF